MTKHLRLQGGEHRKTFPKFVGPFRIARLGGNGNVELELDGRFRFIDKIVNVNRATPFIPGGALSAKVGSARLKEIETLRLTPSEKGAFRSGSPKGL